MNTKQRLWAGETPYDEKPTTFPPHWDTCREPQQDAYRAAMNSLEVRAMYRALKAAPSGEHDINCGIFVQVKGRTMLDESLCRCYQHSRRKALAAYEKGLRDA